MDPEMSRGYKGPNLGTILAGVLKLVAISPVAVIFSVVAFPLVYGFFRF